ncbi:MAG: methyltransferase domain-containing protein [Planctomycetota bacterium]
MLGEQLRDEFLRRSGSLDTTALEVDPADEMLRTTARHVVRQHQELQTYFRRGLDAFHVLEHVQRALGRPLRELDAILDFAAGWGRLTRFLVGETGASRVVVSDIAEASTAFCRRVFGVDSFDSAVDPSEVEPSRTFDLIFVGSLFTHLPRNRFDAWMERLLSWLSPEGSLVLTTHGEGLLQAEDRDASGFSYIGSTPIDYLPVSEYASTYVHPSLVEQVARSCGAAQVVTRERDLWFVHDVHVVRNQVAPALEAISPTPIAHGRIERAEEVRPGHGWVGGTVNVPRALAPLASVELFVDGELLGPFSRLQESELPAESPGLIRYEFLEEGGVSGLGAGTHLVAAVAAWANGEKACVDVVPMTVA